MTTSALASLHSALETLRRLEASARDRGNVERAEGFARLARGYEAEITRLENESDPGPQRE